MAARTLLLGLVLLAAPAAAQDQSTQVFLDKAQALAHVFPGATRVIELRHLLTAAETEAIQARLGVRLEEGGFFLYAAERDGAPLSWAAIVAEVGKVRPITHIVEVRPDGACGRVAVMIFRESHGADVASARFMAQYEGKTLADPIRVDKDVINVAGSTLSAHAICRGVRKALAAVQVVLLDRHRAARRGLRPPGPDVPPGAGAAPAAPADAGEGPLRAERAIMGSLCSVELWPAPGGPDRAALAAAALAALDEVARWDAVLSDWRADTPLSRLNAAPAGQPFAAGADLLAFLRDADGWVAATGGAFDPTVGALVDAWGLRGQAPARPSVATLEAARAATGWTLLALDDDAGTATRTHAGLRLDPGASGKGWALDRAGEVLRARGAVPALLSFRSTLLALGAPPGERGFTLPVVHDGGGRTLTQVLLHDGALSVSGGQAAGFHDGGVERGGCIDPRDGQPVPAAALAWVTHASASAADALSTALLVRGVALPPVDGASGGWYADALAAPVAWPHQP
jgi:thiamine biosynthesis lipoprotein